MFLESPEAKEFAVGFTFKLHLRWCLQLLYILAPSLLLDGMVPLSLMLPTVRTHFRPLHPGALPASLRSSVGCSY